jgi:DNA-binding NarL/FixJ family response regulator
MRKIIIADDHFFVREGIGASLQSVFQNVEVSYAESSKNLLERLTSNTFDLIILDVKMADLDHSFIRHIKLKIPNVKILVFSDISNEKVASYIQQGVEGFLHKSCTKEHLIEALKTLFENKYYFSGDLTKVLLFPSSSKTPKMILSEREFEIFILFSKGYGNLEICNKLFLKSGTVSTYRRRILRKLNISTIADLVKIQMASDDH